MNTAAIWEVRPWCEGEGKEQLKYCHTGSSKPSQGVHTDVPSHCVHIDSLCQDTCMNFLTSITRESRFISLFLTKGGIRCMKYKLKHK